MFDDSAIIPFDTMEKMAKEYYNSCKKQSIIGDVGINFARRAYYFAKKLDKSLFGGIEARDIYKVLINIKKIISNLGVVKNELYDYKPKHAKYEKELLFDLIELLKQVDSATMLENNELIKQKLYDCIGVVLRYC